MLRLDNELESNLAANCCTQIKQQHQQQPNSYLDLLKRHQEFYLFDIVVIIIIIIK